MKQPTWERIATHVILIIACSIALFPVLWIVSTSFKNQFDVLSTEIELIPREPTLENYQNLFDPTTATGGFFWNWFGNSPLISVLTTVLSVFLASTAAYALSRYRFFGSAGRRASSLRARCSPPSSCSSRCSSSGHSARPAEHAVGPRPGACDHRHPVLRADAEELLRHAADRARRAARSTGLGPLGAFWRIVIPLSTPGIAVTAFYAFITAWNEFLYALVFLTRPEAFTLPIGVRLFINQFTQNWGGTMALSVVVTIPVVIFFYLAQRYLISGLSTGGIKG